MPIALNDHFVSFAAFLASNERTNVCPKASKKFNWSVSSKFVPTIKYMQLILQPLLK